MAEILLTAIINKSIEIAGNLLLQEGSRLNWLKEDINWLQREMRHIQSYIDDAKDKAIGGNRRVKNLIKDIQELAGDVEDLLDDFLPKIQQSNSAICRLKTACIPSHASFVDEFAIEIEKIKKRVAYFDRVRKTIVGRCGGVPLAIVVTAGMLRARERTEHAWHRVLESMGHKVQHGCAKDHEIRAFDLINMWIAEKLIVVNSGNMREAESSAEDVLNDLVSRNLIQVAIRKYDGRISSCRIHDLLHSLCVDLAKESNFFHTKHNAFGDPKNVARVRRITFYYDSNAMNEFFRSNPKPMKIRALFCLINDRCLFSDMAHLNFKLLQVLVVVISVDYSCGVSIPNTFRNISCLRYLRFKGNIYGKLPNCMVKLKRLETIDITQFSPNVYSLPPNNLQTLMWMDVKILSALSPVPTALEVLKLRVYRVSEQINLSPYPNIVKLQLDVCRRMCLNCEAFPSNLVKLTLVHYKIDGHVVAVLKKLPKLRILKWFGANIMRKDGSLWW
ncbi:hypothetical protein KY290_037846 [Solanum tuberosum]|uniref:Uncharacterized protein n=1 Tax=Solanum tuberosum TaxID=4113 RepID=A0ABQ7TYC6_SOLTU|nr:hypothetical protein KY284_037219 [Solanum tuberosum]KAH0739141.1 hypothetical protein KY290_037846 [Solanum tuberosum]